MPRTLRLGKGRDGQKKASGGMLKILRIFWSRRALQSAVESSKISLSVKTIP